MPDFGKIMIEIPSPVADASLAPRDTLIKWIWRSYFKTSLLPLLIVEVGLILVYFISNTIASQQNIQTVREQAEHELTQLSLVEAGSINHQFKAIAQATDYLRLDAQRVMNSSVATLRDDPARFAYSPDGAYYTTRNDGNSAVFYSGFTPVGAPERDIAMRSAGLDPAFKGVKAAFPMIVQVYYNSADSLNRIYPYFNVLEQYAPRMNIPSFNFYYEADALHNPARKVVWTDVYADPAGQGWMTSCIAPVYKGDVLEGVTGSDVTVSTVVHDVLNLEIPWHGYGVLISREGNVIALPKVGEADWGLHDVHKPAAGLQQDTFKPDELNIFRSMRNLELGRLLQKNTSGLYHASLAQKSIVSWSVIHETGWKLLVVVPEAEIYQSTHALANRLNWLAWLMVSGMLLFYLVFFFVLFRRARQMSQFISYPLMQIDEMVKGVAKGQYYPEKIEFPVEELHQTAQGIAKMGEQLANSKTARRLVQRELLTQKQQLQSVFDLSPDGFIATDKQLIVVLVNPAFLKMTGTESREWTGIALQAFWDKFSRLCQDNGDLLHKKGLFKIELLRPKPATLLCERRQVDGSQGEGETGEMVIYFRDITRAEELERMKGEFIALAAHELRTPLTSILGYAELMLAGGQQDVETYVDSLSIIYESSKMMDKIITELIDLGKIDARAGRDFKIETLDISEFLATIACEFSCPDGRNPLKIGMNKPVKVNVDPVKFKYALEHVIDNAYRYSSTGEIWLEQVAGTAGHENQIGVRVTDEGIGMTPEECQLIFNRFWRASKSGFIPGSGLGMCLAKEIINILQGAIEVNSVFGAGSQVTIWLPLVTGEEKLMLERTGENDEQI